MNKNKNKLIKEIKFNDLGLVPVVVQQFDTGEVLMMAWMNLEAVEKTIISKKAYYWSRSRNKLWLKGETSGNYQAVHECRIDCDGDTLLLVVDQYRDACHKGYKSCFYRSISEDGEITKSSQTFLPKGIKYVITKRGKLKQ